MGGGRGDGRGKGRWRVHPKIDTHNICTSSANNILTYSHLMTSHPLIHTYTHHVNPLLTQAHHVNSLLTWAHHINPLLTRAHHVNPLLTRAHHVNPLLTQAQVVREHWSWLCILPSPTRETLAQPAQCYWRVHEGKTSHDPPSITMTTHPLSGTVNSEAVPRASLGIKAVGWLLMRVVGVVGSGVIATGNRFVTKVEGVVSW